MNKALRAKAPVQSEEKSDAVSDRPGVACLDQVDGCRGWTKRNIAARLAYIIIFIFGITQILWAEV